MNDLSQIIAKSPMTVISAAINKIDLKRKYSKPSHPYNLALKFCLERLHRFLSIKGQHERTTHLIFEKRGKDEDRDLELEFRRIKDGVNFSAEKYPNMEIIFADKRTNSAGLQFADLIARPIGLKQSNPTQHNRAYDIIEKKFDIDRNGDFLGVGLKPFP